MGVFGCPLRRHAGALVVGTVHLESLMVGTAYTGRLERRKQLQEARHAPAIKY